MLDVFLTTASKISVLLIFILVGYLLRVSRKLPDNAARVLSVLTTTVFTPAYNIKNLSASMTLEKIGGNLKLVGYGLVFILVIIVAARIASKLLAKNDFELSTYNYAFTFPNYGYFGYPLIEGVFGTAVLSQVMVFSLPMALACSTYGYLLFMRGKKLTLGQILRMPLILAVILGCVLGLTGLQLPGILSDAVSTAAGCMSPASMLLAGFVLGGFPPKELLKGGRSYIMSAIRLLGIPALVAGVLWLVGMRGMYLALPVMILSMPLGLNLVVYPESLGIDASPNARMCFVCNLLTVLILPFTFSLLSLVM